MGKHSRHLIQDEDYDDGYEDTEEGDYNGEDMGNENDYDTQGEKSHDQHCHRVTVAPVKDRAATKDSTTSFLDLLEKDHHIRTSAMDIESQINLLLNHMDHSTEDRHEMHLVEQAIHLLTIQPDEPIKETATSQHHHGKNKSEPKSQSRASSAIYQALLSSAPKTESQHRQITLESYLNELAAKYNHSRTTYSPLSKPLPSSSVSKEDQPTELKTIRPKHKKETKESIEPPCKSAVLASKEKKVTQTTIASTSKDKKSNITEKAKKLHEEMTMALFDNKPLLYLIVVGHVDAGKSTLLGHLLYLLGQVDAKQLSQYERESKRSGKPTFQYAWILDESKEERARGITMDVSMQRFDITNKRIIILDAPGHSDFVPSMIYGSFLADVGILLVDAGLGAFEAGFSEGSQTREHATILKHSGVSQVIVAINKLDKVDWSKERFIYIKDTLSDYFVFLGFDLASVHFIPLSAYLGVNLVSHHDEPLLSRWWTGPSLIELLNSIESKENTRSLIDLPFRGVVHHIIKSSSVGNVSIDVKIYSGGIRLGDVSLLLPLNQKCTVKSIEMKTKDEMKTVKHAFANEYVTLTLSGIDPLAYKSGMLLGLGKDHCETPLKILAKISILNEANEPILPGLPYFCEKVKWLRWRYPFKEPSLLKPYMASNLYRGLY